MFIVLDTHTREKERMTIVCHGKKKKTWKTRQSKFIVRSFDVYDVIESQ